MNKKRLSFAVLFLSIIVSHVFAAQFLINRDAVMNDDVLEVKKAIENGADVNMKHEDGTTALSWAAIKNSLEVAKLLIENGADVNAKDKNGNTPLHFATFAGHFDMAKNLIQAGAEVHIRNKLGETPLINTYIEPFLENESLRHEMISYLEQNGANKKEIDTLYPCDIDNRGVNVYYPPLLVVAAKGDIKELEILVKEGVDINSTYGGYFSLTLAAMNCRYETVRWLIEAGAEINVKQYDDKTALHLAAENCDFKIVEYLVNKGAGIDIKDRDGDTPLDIVIKLGKKELEEYLRSKLLPKNSH